MPNNIEKLLTALASPANAVEDAFQQLLTMRSIFNGVGIVLDQIGDIVGQKRDGLTDDAYRLYLFARIATNRSSGRRGDLLRIARLIVGAGGQIVVRTIYNASLILEVRGLVVTDDAAAALETMLGEAVVAGVRIQVVSSSLAASAVFRFDSGPGLDVGQLARGTDNAS